MNNHDISKLENIDTIYNNLEIKKWIKLISIENTILFSKYNRKDYFIPIVDITLDNELFTSGKKKGTKKRNTLIKFVPIISCELFNKKNRMVVYNCNK